MNFWGLEVKPGAKVKVNPGEDRYLHLSQASIGEVKKDALNENVVLSLKVDDQQLVIGTLNAERCAQIQFDVVFEKEFELSHNSKHSTVYFIGYKGAVEDNEPFDEDLSSDEEEVPLAIAPEAKKSGEKKELNSSTVANAAKATGLPAKAKADHPKTSKPEVQEEDDDDDDDSEDFSSDDEDNEMDEDGSDEDEDEEDEDDSEDEATPQKSDNGKKRPGQTVSTPAQAKKAKLVSPAGAQKTAGDSKKGGAHTATPHPSKQAGKPAATPKSEGSVVCKTCSKSFGSENALQAHSKAKHGKAK